MITCKVCKEKKEQSEYYKSNSKKNNYLRADCKSCVINKSSFSQSLNKEKRKEYLKDYRIKNIVKLSNDKKIYRIKWNAENKGYMNNYNINRRKTDDLYRIKHNLRNRMNLAFRKKNWIKNGGSEILLGENIAVVKSHIEKQFTKGMSWSNYGEWHIDHIKPLSIAKDEKELNELCNYKNLQPLWKLDNILKRDKY